jgi:hypothetical protein
MELNIGIPQIIYLSFVVGSLCIDAYNHNKPITKKVDIKISAAASMLIMLLLYWGGFFS